MKKRLRKKKYLGEFKEFGWYVDYQFESPNGESEDYFLELLMNKVDSMEVMIGGNVVSFFATLEHRSLQEVVQQRREQLHEWLAQQPGVTEVNSSPLTDAWYGSFQE